MEFLIMLGLFGCAAYAVAKSKDRNPVLWFCLGLVIGPFAALILAFMSAGPNAEKGYRQS